MSNTNISSLSEGDVVTDSWYPEWDEGVCVKAGKTFWSVRFNTLVQTYDKQHLTYLTRVVKKDKIMKRRWEFKEIALAYFLVKSGRNYTQVSVTLGRTYASVNSMVNKYVTGAMSSVKYSNIMSVVDDIEHGRTEVNALLKLYAWWAVSNTKSTHLVTSEKNAQYIVCFKNSEGKLSERKLTKEEALKTHNEAGVNNTTIYKLVEMVVVNDLEEKQQV